METKTPKTHDRHVKYGTLPRASFSVNKFDRALLEVSECSACCAGLAVDFLKNFEAGIASSN